MGELLFKLKALKDFIGEVIKEWGNDKGWLLSAALAFYSLFSLAPLLIITIAIAGIIFGQSNAEDAIISHLQSLAGERGTRALKNIAFEISLAGKSIPAMLVGFAALFIGASTLFFQMRHSLNEIWKAEQPNEKFFIGYIKARVTAFIIAVGGGILVLVSLISSSLLSALAEQLEPAFGQLIILWKTLDFVLSYAVLTVLFAMLYKYVPDAHIKWKDVWVGAITASLLYNAAKFLISLYLGHSSVGSAYGAAGSLVVLLVWINISAQIFLLGGEVAQVYARHKGRIIAH
ncbi:MAG: YihY family inner membrane protein [Chitinivibrionales bacterium]|nr:YihY family inner membrane protein [Chitinivibrionales bacterium]